MDPSYVQGSADSFVVVNNSATANFTDCTFTANAGNTVYSAEVDSTATVTYTDCTFDKVTQR